MEQINRLNERLKAGISRIAVLREEIANLEVTNHNYAIAIAVLMDLDGLGDPSEVSKPTVSISQIKIDAGIPVPPKKVGIKQLILAQLYKASPLTRMDIVSRLHNEGHLVNSTTVASMLSKMVGEEVEKVGLSMYRPKGEAPMDSRSSGASSATESNGSFS